MFLKNYKKLLLNDREKKEAVIAYFMLGTTILLIVMVLLEFIFALTLPSLFWKVYALLVAGYILPTWLSLQADYSDRCIYEDLAKNLFNVTYDKSKENWANEYNKFVKELATFDISEIREYVDDRVDELSEFYSKHLKSKNKSQEATNKISI